MVDMLPSRPVVWRAPGLAASIGAVLLWCLSLTPSLLPRHWALQGILSGITMATGYGAGAAVGAVARLWWPWHTAPSRRTRAVLAAVGAALAGTFLVLGHGWEQEVRALVGASAAAAWEPPLVVVAAAGTFTLLLLLARLARLGGRKVAAAWHRSLPHPVASVAAVSVVAAFSYGLGPAAGATGALDLATQVVGGGDSVVASGGSPPTSPYVTGGPGSAVPWASLGQHGRAFTASAVPRPDLAEFTDGGAESPIRVYVGQDSAPTLTQRAALAVRELERTGAFDRSVLTVVGTTGSGWVNPVLPATMEYLYGGDTAVVAMQYSHLPSWMSYLVDSSRATQATAVLLDAVRQRLAAVPAADRPALVVAGESLGAHGVESAFGDLAELLAGTDGALLVGPLHTNPLWRQAVVEGELGGRVVVGDQVGAALAAAGDRPEAVFLQNASDPVSWWSPELLYRRPPWLQGDRAPGVSGAMRWFPVVTFWQVSVDLVASTGVPSGHGHSYGAGIPDALVALGAPAGWTDADSARLHSVLAGSG